MSRDKLFLIVYPDAWQFVGFYSYDLLGEMKASGCLKGCTCGQAAYHTHDSNPRDLTRLPISRLSDVELYKALHDEEFFNERVRDTYAIPSIMLTRHNPIDAWNIGTALGEIRLEMLKSLAPFDMELFEMLLYKYTVEYPEQFQF